MSRDSQHRGPKAQDRGGSGAHLLSQWNSLLEDSKERAKFFESVVEDAKTVHNLSPASHLKTQCFSTEGYIDTK
jgi:hypothetical protein